MSAPVPAPRGRRSDPLDYAERHPLLGFMLDANDLTDTKANVMLAFGPVLVVSGLATTTWPAVVIGALMTAWLPRNYRRYKQRLFHALADRDRPPGSEPLHPDLR